MTKLDFDSLYERVSSSYYRLIIIAGKQQTGKTRLLNSLSDKFCVEITNLNLKMSEKLLNIPRAKRYLYVSDYLSDIIGYQNEISLIDNIEILFDNNLKMNSLALLQRFSRNKTIICTWTGQVLNNKLTYAEPTHLEFRSYEIIDFQLIDMNEDNYEI